MNSKVFARGKAGDTVWRKMLSVLSIILLTGLISLAGAPHAGSNSADRAGTAFGPEKAWAVAVPVPVLDPGDDWYKGTTAKSAFTTINIVDDYWPDGTELESWDASVANNFSVAAYVSADGKTLTITGNGYGKIMANEYSRFLFKGFSSVTAINGTEILDVSNVTDFQSAFSGCSALVALDLDNWNVKNVVTMGSMFDECSALTTFGSNELGSWNTSSLQIIGSAFYKCESLTKIDVSDWDMSSCTAYNHAFMGCTSLVELDVSKWDTSAATEFIRLFYGCESLPVIDISSWDSANVKRMGEMFSGCRAVKELDFSNFNTSNCTDMYALLWQCNNLTTLKGMDTLDTSKVEDFTYMFCGCRSLTSLDLSNFETSACTDGFLGMFYNCYALEVLDISSFDMRNGRDMNSVMEGCRNLRQISVGENFSFSGTNDERKFSFPTPDPTYIPGATGQWQAVGTGTVDAPMGAVYDPADVPEFVAETYVMPVSVAQSVEPVLAEGSTWYTSSVDKSTFTTINIVDFYTVTGTELESWDASAEQNGSVMAYISADGKTLTIAGNGYGHIRANSNSEKAFQGFSFVTHINGVELLDVSKTYNMIRMFEDCNRLTSLNLDSWDTQSLTYAAYAFMECFALTSFGSNNLAHLDMSNVSSCYSMFQSCNSLQALDVSSWDMSSCVTMYSMFYECKSLTTLDVSNWDVSNAVRLFGLFDGCSGVTELDVSKWNTSKAISFSALFRDCSSLQSIDVSSFDTSKSSSFSHMFAGCKNLKVIDVSNFDTSQAHNLQAMFRNCTSITSLDLSNFDTANVKEFGYFVESCSSLTDLDVSSFDTSSGTEFVSMFQGCSALEVLDIDNFVGTSASDLRAMFQGCSKLKEIDLSNFNASNFDSLWNFVRDCSSLEVLDIGGLNTSNTTYMSYAFDGCNMLQQVTLGEGFSFNGSGTTRLNNLPTPDPAYIDGATGKWQAVAGGTVDVPVGTIYLPEDIPNNVAETYVMPIATLSVDVPIKVTLAAASDGTWCTPTAAANQIINHSLAPVNVVAAETNSANGFTMLAASSVEGSTASNVFGGTIAAGTGTAQDLTSIDTSADAWTMAAETDADDSDLISLQLAGSVGNVEGTYFTEAAQLFGITYTFELAL